jgi:hypothetical protein
MRRNTLAKFIVHGSFDLLYELGGHRNIFEFGKNSILSVQNIVFKINTSNMPGVRNEQ